MSAQTRHLVIYPIYRGRRIRSTETTRRLVRETSLSPDDLVYPMFVVPGTGVKKEISSMPGQYHFSTDSVVKEAKEVASLGIPAIILFGIPETKDEKASEAYRTDGVVQEAIRGIKKALPDLVTITDVCLCEYMSHGHCGIIENDRILNDPSLELLAKTAVSHARAGADMVAPSDMMDGRVAAIREALDDADFDDLPVMSYAAKYASSFYGPFREAAESTPSFGDRRSYQMDPGNKREAIRETQMDIDEGADIVMVKPALSYLDIISLIRERFDYPLAAYNVSGEYSMVKAAAARDWIDGRKVALEILTSIKRAGADIILTYHAKEAAGWISG